MKTVVITGSTRGIGLGLARAMLERGANVVISSRSQNDVERTLRELSAPIRAHGLACDVTRFDAVEALWQAAEARFGRVDIWINNAGATTTPVTLDAVPPDEIARTVHTNLIGALYGCKVAARGMRAQGSGFIYNMEGLGSRGQVQEGLLTYGATKAAIHYVMKALRKELEGTGVKVCAIGPGINVTEHLLYGAHALSEKRWRSTKKIFNILGDHPDTTTPWLAQRILDNDKDGAKIDWLTSKKAAYRFMLAPFRRRDLFAEIDEARVRRVP
jgi:NAD(P)-dependent dehydrogenase (short-subunit alcohol dehydrogenase family)